jgi:cephalosporin-C deacetylase
MMKLSILFLAALLVALSVPASAGDALDDFWRHTRERLAAEPMDAQVERVAGALPYRTMKVTLRSLDGVRVRALLGLPVQGEAPAKPWPVVVTAPGYSGTQQGVMLSECQRGYAILQIFPRGQGESAELWTLDGDKLAASLDRPEGAYYQGAYADVIRAIDFASSRDDLDRERIALVATSQGGGMALAVAALDSRVKAVVAHLPFLCDFRAASQTPGALVKTLLDRTRRNDELALRTLDYFDPRELAPRLRAPVLISAGGKDMLCPAATIRSVHERLAGEKTLKFYPDLAHTSCVDFYNLTWTWLDQRLRAGTP